MTVAPGKLDIDKGIKYAADLGYDSFIQVMAVQSALNLHVAGQEDDATRDVQQSGITIVHWREILEAARAGTGIPDMKKESVGEAYLEAQSVGGRLDWGKFAHELELRGWHYEPHRPIGDEPETADFSRDRLIGEAPPKGWA